MLNELVYCPRLFYLEHVGREFVESHDTLDGSRVHQRVDTPRAHPSAADLEVEGVLTSFTLSSERLGIVGVIDVVEQLSDEMIPVDYKRGKPPPNPERSWEPERVQLCLQGMLLEEAGYRCDHGFLYFAGAKTRVRVEFGDELRARSLEAIADARRLRKQNVPPVPLRDSPKCPRCSLVSICLPDETNALRTADAAPPRPLIPLEDDALPLYVVTPGAMVTKRDETLIVRKDDEVLETVRLGEITQIALFGGAHMSEAAMRAALDSEIPVLHFSFGGWLSGMSVPPAQRNVLGRIEQFRAFEDPARSLPMARAIVEAKIRNQRTLVRRSLGNAASAELRRLAWVVDRVGKVRELGTLLGYEGWAARVYFSVFGRMLRNPMEFDLAGRNRRPPKDPINVLLSFLYALLVKETTAAVLSVGLDPAVGMYHAIRPGRPSLALDLAEEFRPLVADSVVLSVVNTREIDERAFVARGNGMALTIAGRKTMIEAFERRLGQTVTHPIFGYTISYRRIIYVQARLLARAITGELERYPAFTTR
jgi:CRISPR-associated protein Cas1